MKKNKKLFAFDVDGTILNNKNKILNETIYALKKAKKEGHIITLATGRPWVFLKNMKKIKMFDYLICNNGSYYVEQNTDKKYLEKDLSKEVVLKMIKMAKKNKSIILISDVNKIVGTIFGSTKKMEDEFNKQWKETIEIIPYQLLFDYIDKHLITQSSILSSYKKLKIMEQELIKCNYKIEIKIANLKYLDANPKDVSKFSAIKKIKKEMDINNDDIITFGDSGNDIEMLKEAGIGIAMENGTKEAKTIADEIIGNNNTPAIANKILEIIK